MNLFTDIEEITLCCTTQLTLWTFVCLYSEVTQIITRTILHNKTDSGVRHLWILYGHKNETYYTGMGSLYPWIDPHGPAVLRLVFWTESPWFEPCVSSSCKHGRSVQRCVSKDMNDKLSIHYNGAKQHIGKI